MHVEVPAVVYSDLVAEGSGEPSAEIRRRVVAARKIQVRRLQKSSIRANAGMNTRHIRQYCVIDAESEQIVKNAADRLGLSARAYHRVLKIARTIADLEASARIRPPHILEAIGYRSMDRPV
jgi:magnesium chelatase family protein